ncbi:DsbA family protein [Mesobacillus harenae]|uniref:DsbA family protein n=1 Tax=Mesobacillus harenae TaxID=2213203 RepID=UPI00157FCD21
MGKKRLEDALQKINHPVEVVYRSFELDPTAKRDIKENIYEKLASKYGMSIGQAKANTDNMVQMAKSIGLDYQMETMVLTNTFDAHRLAMFAKNKGLMNEMTDRLLRAYYTESKHIGDHETLIGLAAEVGLDRDQVAKMLASDEMSDAVRADEQEAANLGINSIPFFLINKKYAVTGAQSEEVFIQTIEQVLEQDGPYEG